MQHGLATDKAENPERSLSAQGIDNTSAIAKQLKLSVVPVSKVFHSGKLRAQQTAEIIATELSITTSAIEHLSANDDAKLFTQQLNTNYALYVGHLPHLENLVSLLLAGREKPPLIKFQNSAVACLECHGDFYQLSWYLTPDLTYS